MLNGLVPGGFAPESVVFVATLGTVPKVPGNGAPPNGFEFAVGASGFDASDVFSDCFPADIVLEGVNGTPNGGGVELGGIGTSFVWFSSGFTSDCALGAEPLGSNGVPNWFDLGVFDLVSGVRLFGSLWEDVTTFGLLLSPDKPFSLVESNGFELSVEELSSDTGSVIFGVIHSGGPRGPFVGCLATGESVLLLWLALAPEEDTFPTWLFEASLLLDKASRLKAAKGFDPKEPSFFFDSLEDPSSTPAGGDVGLKLLKGLELAAVPSTLGAGGDCFV